MILNQLHHKIFTTQWQTVPLWPQSLCQRSLVHLVHSFIQTELCCFLRTSRILITQFPFVAQSQIKTYHPGICFFLYERWNSVEKIPWGRNILLFFVLFCCVFFGWKRSHYRHWQARSEFATISADDLARAHRALGDTDHFGLPVLHLHCENKSSLCWRSY